MAPKHISRRNFVRQLPAAGAAAAVIGIPALGAAQALTPQERIHQHIEGIKQVMREIHPNLSTFGEFNAIGTETVGHTRLGSTVFICANLKA